MTTGTDESTDVADVNDTTPSAGSALEDGMTFRPINYNRSAAAARRSANRCSPWDDVDEDKDIAPFSPTSPTSNGARFASVSTISTTHRRSSHAPQKAFLANVWGVLAHPGRRFEARLRRLDPVKLAYLRTSFVFALSVLVTWTPSSINRVYTLAHPQDSSFGLNMASAVVLPLQGVWNCVIYSALSWAVLLEEVTELGIARGWWFPRPQVAPSMRGLRRGSERLGSGADGLPSGTPLDYHLAVPAPATQRGSGARGRAWDVPGEDGSRDIEMMGRGSTAGCGGGGTLRVFRGGSF